MVPGRYIVDQDTGVPQTPIPDFPRDDLVEASVIELDDDGELTRTRVTGGRHAGASFAKARLTDVELVRCDLAGCDFSEARFTRVAVVDCRAIALEAGQAQLHGVAIVDSILRDANLRLTTLADVLVEGSSMTGAEFVQAKLERVTFGGTDLSRADFTKVACASVDLRDARLDDLKGVGSLRGATIAPDQAVALAPALAFALGVTIAGRQDAPVQSPPVGTTGGD